MKQPISTLCSLALLFWGYQTGAWILAIPMAFMIEGRDVVQQLGQTLEDKGVLRLRQKISWDALQRVHVLAGFLWLVSMFYIPTQSPFPLPHTIQYHLVSGLPVLLFPCILAQTYCVESVALYSRLLKRPLWFSRPINFYYPYFGLCLFAASVTGGHYLLFLIVVSILVGGFLWTTQRPSTKLTRKIQASRRPSSRFSIGTFSGLVGLALIISILGTHQLYWLQSNIKIQGPSFLGDLVQQVTSLFLPSEFQLPEAAFDGDMPLERSRKDLEDAIANSLTPSNQRPPNTSSTDSTQETPAENVTADALQNIARPAAESDSPEELDSSQDIDPSEESDAANLPQDLAQTIEQVESLEGTESQLETAPENPSLDLPPETPETNGPSSSQNKSQQPSGNHGTGPSTSTPSLPSLTQGAGGIVDPEQSATNIGKTGSIQPSNAILFRVTPVTKDSQSPAPTFPLHIRAATYNRYTAGTWKAVKPKFTPQAPQANRRLWTLGSKAAQTTSVRISATLPQRKDTLKLPAGTSAIQDLAVDSMAVNQYGTVSIEGKPGPIAYTVQFDTARSLDSPPTQADRSIPEAERQTLRKVIKSLNLKRKSETEVVQAVSTFFQSDFQYSLELAQPKQKRTPLAAFLLDHRSGHCEYFASATSLLLREAGIPTRYAVGYYVHEYSLSEQQYLVRASNAHAWVMAYINGTWMTVDTTPGGGTSQGTRATIETAETGSRNVASNSEAGPETNTAQANNPENGTSLADQLSDTLSSVLSKAPEKLAPLLLLAAVGVVGVAIALSAFFYLLWRLYRRLHPHSSVHAARRRYPLQPSMPEPTFYLIEQRLADWNLRRDVAESPKRWILRLQQQLPTSQIEELQQIVDLHYRYRFDPQGIDPEDQTKLQALIQAWLNAYRQRPQASRDSSHP